ncbi:MAG: DUF1573 domain-containing protein [Phycisphaerae bacterium]|nr:DUF1573 domain-containing protein [Phycisphaerae bacterium]
MRSPCILTLAASGAIALVAPLVGVAKGSQPPPSGEQVAVPKGELTRLRVVSTDPENLGRVQGGMALTRRITFENSSLTPVALRVVSKSCGCLDATFDTESVAPMAQAVLTMRVVPASVPGEQVQTVTFRTAWNETNVGRTELGVCAIRYETDQQFVVRPESAIVPAVVGSVAHLDVHVRILTEKETKPQLTWAACTLPGWSAAPVQDPALPPGVLRVRASGSAPEQPGIMDGWIELAADAEAKASVRVSIRLETRSRYRTEPGGVVFFRPDGATASTLALRPNADTALAPAKVGLSTPTPWLAARLVEGSRVEVSLTPTADMPAHGVRRIRVWSESGVELADVPVCWWTTPAR